MITATTPWTIISYWPCNDIKAFYLPQSWNMHRKPLIETQTYLKCSYPEPIMGYNIINSKYRGKCSEGLKCTLYAARQSSVQNKWQLNPQANKSFSRILYSIFPKATNSSNWTERLHGFIRQCIKLSAISHRGQLQGNYRFSCPVKTGDKSILPRPFPSPELSQLWDYIYTSHLWRGSVY